MFFLLPVTEPYYTGTAVNRLVLNETHRHLICRYRLLQYTNSALISQPAKYNCCCLRHGCPSPLPNNWFIAKGKNRSKAVSGMDRPLLDIQAVDRLLAGRGIHTSSCLGRPARRLFISDYGSSSGRARTGQSDSRHC